MLNLIGNENVGYKVVKQGKRAVLAHKQSTSKILSNQYVAWSYKVDEDGTVDYFWGHYGLLGLAEEAFNDKEDRWID